MNLFYNIAIVGRPNVGKSRLFNRLIQKRISIVHDMPGVTRDIISYEIGNRIVLMDTGGLGLSGNTSVDEITSAVDKQVKFAISVADLVFFVVDVSTGIMPMDYDIADILRKSSSNVVVIANKSDTKERFHLAMEFKKFGFGDPIISSAEHGIGEDDIRRVIANETREFSKKLESEEQIFDPIKVAFIGRPNVGKSSTINALLDSERVIVSDIPGTTRESVTIKFPKAEGSKLGRDFELLDTAGLRPQNRITTSLDYFSSLRTHDGMINCDVIFLVIDATSGVTQLDKKIANEIIEAGKGLIVVVNKWDIAQKSHRNGDLQDFKDLKSFQESFLIAVREELKSLPEVEVIFISAERKYGIRYLLVAAEKLFNRMNAKIGTGKLNREIQYALEKHPPSVSGGTGKRFRIYYVVQSGNMPFVFKVFCNRKALLHDSYRKYLINALRKNFDFSGCPINLEFIEKMDVISKPHASDH